MVYTSNGRHPHYRNFRRIFVPLAHMVLVPNCAVLEFLASFLNSTNFKRSSCGAVLSIDPVYGLCSSTAFLFSLFYRVSLEYVACNVIIALLYVLSRTALLSYHAFS